MDLTSLISTISVIVIGVGVVMAIIYAVILIINTLDEINKKLGEIVKVLKPAQEVEDNEEVRSVD